MDHVVRTGALARLDSDPSDELASWNSDLERGRIDDPAETRRRLEAYERGEQAIVRLEVFADLEHEGRIIRRDGIHVTGVWFETGAGQANVGHAREMIASHLDELHADLASRHGLEVSFAELAAAPIVVELDAELASKVV
jgi:hypothetical protein